MNKQNLKYHHLGIPTETPIKGDTYLPDYKVYRYGYDTSEYGIEWMRYEEDCSLPEIVKTLPHVAFEVDDVYEAIKDKKIIIQPNSPYKGIIVAFIEEDGAPIELIQEQKGNQTESPKKKQNLKYHHLGIPTKTPRKGEVYLPDYKVYHYGYDKSEYGIEWMRYEKECTLPEIVKTLPHVSFEVDDVYEAIKDKKVIIQPNSPSENVIVAFIEENGAPIELIQFTKK